MSPPQRTLLALLAALVLPVALAQPLPPLLQADGTLHPGWRYVGFPKQKADIPPTVIEAGQVDGQPAGRQGTNPYTRRVRYISLRGSETPARQWVTENRDLARDFATLFADELPAGGAVPPLRTVLIGADSDNTASRSSGWVADLRSAAP